MVLLGNALFAMGSAFDGNAIAGLTDFVGKDAMEDVVGDVAERVDIMRAPEELRHILGGGDPRELGISRPVKVGSEDRVFIEGSFSNDAALKFLDGCVLFGIAGVVGAGFWFSNPMRYPKRYYPDAPPPERIPRSVVTPGAQLVALEQRSVPTPILPDIAAVLTKEPQDMTPEDVIVLVRGFRDSVYDSADWHKIQGLLITALSDASVDNQLATLQEMGIIIAQQKDKTNYICYSYVNLLNRYIDNIRDKRKAGINREINPQTKRYLMALLDYWLGHVFERSSTSHRLCLAMLPRLREI